MHREKGPAIESLFTRILLTLKFTPELAAEIVFVRQ
jgi:hypothetical protein